MFLFFLFFICSEHSHHIQIEHRQSKEKSFNWHNFGKWFFRIIRLVSFVGVAVIALLVDQKVIAIIEKVKLNWKEMLEAAIKKKLEQEAHKAEEALEEIPHKIEEECSSAFDSFCSLFHSKKEVPAPVVVPTITRTTTTTQSTSILNSGEQKIYSAQKVVFGLVAIYLIATMFEWMFDFLNVSKFKRKIMVLNNLLKLPYKYESKYYTFTLNEFKKNKITPDEILNKKQIEEIYNILKEKI